MTRNGKAGAYAIVALYGFILMFMLVMLAIPASAATWEAWDTFDTNVSGRWVTLGGARYNITGGAMQLISSGTWLTRSYTGVETSNNFSTSSIIGFRIMYRIDGTSGNAAGSVGVGNTMGLAGFQAENLHDYGVSAQMGGGNLAALLYTNGTAGINQGGYFSHGTVWWNLTVLKNSNGTWNGTIGNTTNSTVRVNITNAAISNSSFTIRILDFGSGVEKIYVDEIYVLNDSATTYNATVTLDAPANGSNITDANLTYTVSNAAWNTDCSLVSNSVILNSTYNVSNQTLVYQFNNTAGNWTWGVNCSNGYATQQQWFLIYEAPPVPVSTNITLSSPLGGVINSSVTFEYNVSTTNPALLCSVTVNSTVVNTQSITTNGSKTYAFSGANATRSPYSWLVNCSDGNTTAARSVIYEWANYTGNNAWVTYDDFANNTYRNASWEALVESSNAGCFSVQNGSLRIAGASCGGNHIINGQLPASSSVGVQASVNLSSTNYGGVRWRFTKSSISESVSRIKLQFGDFNSTLAGMNGVQPNGVYGGNGDTGGYRAIQEQYDGTNDTAILNVSYALTSTNWTWLELTWLLNGTFNATYYSDVNGEPGSILGTNLSTVVDTNSSAGKGFRMLDWTGGSATLYIDKVEIYNRTGSTPSTPTETTVPQPNDLTSPEQGTTWATITYTPRHSGGGGAGYRVNLSGTPETTSGYSLSFGFNSTPSQLFYGGYTNFVTTVNATLDGFDVRMAKVGTPSGTLRGYILTNNTGNFTTACASNSTLTQADLVAEPANATETFTFSNCTLSTGTNYYYGVTSSVVNSGSSDYFTIIGTTNTSHDLYSHYAAFNTTNMNVTSSGKRFANSSLYTSLVNTTLLLSNSTVLFNGTSNGSVSVNATGLSPGTIYSFSVLSWFWNGSVIFTNQSVVYGANLLNVTTTFPGTAIANIYNEVTRSVLTDVEVTVSFIGPTNVTSTTTTGTLNISNLTDGNYTIRYSADGWGLRDQYLAVNTTSGQNVTLYLINDTYSVNGVVQVRDTQGDYVEGAIVKLLRYYGSTNSYNTVQMATTQDNLGEAGFTAQAYNAYYKWIIEYNGVTEYASSNPETLTPDSSGLWRKYFVIDIGNDFYSSFRGGTSTYTSLTYNNSTKAVTFTWNDPEGLTTQGCVSCRYANGSRWEDRGTCSAGSAGSVVQVFSTANATTHMCRGYRTTSTTYSEPVDKTLTIDADKLFDFGTSGAFIGVFGMVIGGALMFSYSAIAVILWSIFSVAALSISQYFHLLPFGLGFVIGFATLGLGFIVYLMRR